MIDTAPRGSAASSRWWMMPALVACIAIPITRWATAPYLVGVFHDDGVYALLAKAIASGRGFHFLHLPGAPAATHYPPLYPMLLAAIWRVIPGFPTNVPALLGVNAVCVGVAAAGGWCFVTERLAWPPRPSALLALTAGLASPTLLLAGALLSESLFLACLWPSLIACERALRSSDRKPLLGAALLAGMLMLVRMHAVALAAAVLLVLCSRARWRDAGTFAALVAAVQLPWQLWSRFAAPPVVASLEGSYGSYAGWFVAGVRDGGASFVAATLRANVAETWLLVRDRVCAAPLGTATIAAGIALVCAAAGAWSLKRNAPGTLCFLAAYLTVLLAWPYAPWRFLWGIWPLLILTAFEGVRFTMATFPRTRILAILAAGLPAVAMARTELHAYASRSWRTPAREAAAKLTPVIRWVESHTTPADAVLTEGDATVTLYSNRRAAPPIAFTAREYLSLPRAAENEARLGAMLAEVPVRYAILISPAAIRAADARTAGHPSLRRREVIEGGVVYDVAP